jgi:hypothetical protein
LGKWEYNLAGLLAVDFSNVPSFVNLIHRRGVSSLEKGAGSSLTLHIDKKEKKIPYIVIFS